MSRGLSKRPFAVFNGGGIDTKTDQRLVPAGELVEIENMFMLKTGELRLRNGFSALPTSLYQSGGLDSLYTLPGGVLGAHSLAWGGTPAFTQMPVRYRNAGGASGWMPAQPLDPATLTGVTGSVGSVAISGIEAMQTNNLSTASDLVDPDLCIANGAQLATWTDPVTGSGQRFQIKTLSGQPLNTDQFTTIASPLSRPPVLAAGGNTYLCAFVGAGGGAPWDIKAYTWDATGALVNSGTIVAAGLSNANPFIDAKPIPGGNNIAVAYRANAGGVTCGIFNPSTGVFATTVNTAADATLCLGFLDDSLATGNMYLATAGTVSGVVVRTMNAGTMVVSATNIIDAAATANVRQITGHINTSATNYVVLWDVAPTADYTALVKRGAWTGAAAVLFHVRQFSLYSRSFKAPNGLYYYVASYDSATQPTYAVIEAGAHNDNRGVLSALVMPGFAGGRRFYACSLSSVSLAAGVSYLAMARKQRTVASNGAFLSVRSIQRAAVTISTASLRRPRELGGTVFFPGGLVTRDDGKWQTWATFPFYPEPATAVDGGGGALTAGGVYSYKLVYRRTDINGRIYRSATSTPTSHTLGGAANSIDLTIPNPKQMAAFNAFTALVENPFIEIYRAGPAAAGATGYNKVGEIQADASTAAGATLPFSDVMADSDAALGELLYTTGGVLEGFSPPSSTLLEVNNNRVGIVNSEDPTEFWPSLEFKPGQGIKFNPLLSIRVTGDGYGPITALAAMDGRWILFKSSAVHVISGSGPNDLGQGAFGDPTAASLSIGTVLPGSVVATPDGIMFQAAAGIYLLDRGLGLTYIGAPVEQYTLAANVVDASLVTGVTQVRFVMASGRCLVWDYHHKRWYTFQLRVGASTVVACANSSTLGWCYALADGTVMQETPGVYSDVNGSSTAIVPRIGFPALALAGINGFERFYGVDILGEYVGDHTLAVDFEYDYSGGVTETRTRAITAGPYQYEVLPTTQKHTSVKITLRTSALAAGSGAFKLSGLTLWGGMKKGAYIPFTKRVA
jgi:hypothetical protein